MTRPVHRVRDELIESLNMLIDCVPLFDDAVRTLREQQPGYPTGGNGSRSSSPTSQPERLSGAAGSPYSADVAVRDEARLWQSIALIHGATRAVYGVLVANGVRRTPLLDMPDDPNGMWCRSCLRVNHHSVRRSAGGDLCRWCQERRPEGWAMPPLAAVDAYSRGVTVTASLMERAIRAEQPKESKKAKKQRMKRKGHYASSAPRVLP